MRRAAVAALGVAALVALGGRAAAAETAPPGAPAPKTAPAANTGAAPKDAPAPPAAERPPPYEPQLLRLAEMLGALAYLRDLCGAGDGDKFRAGMAGLLGAEGVSEARRDRLAGAYNRGFQDYRTTYRTCTPAANAIIARYLAETARLTADVAGRYGG